MNLRTRGEGVQKPENFADVLNGSPLKMTTHCLPAELIQAINQTSYGWSKNDCPKNSMVISSLSLIRYGRSRVSASKTTCAEGNWVKIRHSCVSFKFICVNTTRAIRYHVINLPKLPSHPLGIPCFNFLISLKLL